MADSEKIEEIRAEFYRKLSTISPLPLQSGNEVARRFHGIGITHVKFRAPVCIFSYEPDKSKDYQQLEIWLENPDDIEDRRQPHWEARENLNQFAIDKDFATNGQPVSGYLFQDDLDRLHLSIERSMAKELVGRVKTDSWQRRSWGRLIEEYKLEVVFGLTENERKVEIDGVTYSVRDERITNLLDTDFVEQIREENYLLSFAERFRMTNSQYLRFRLLALGAKDAKVSVVYESLAREIVADS